MNNNNLVTCFFAVNASPSSCGAKAPRREHLLFTDANPSAQSDFILGFVALASGCGYKIPSQILKIILATPLGQE